MESLFTANWISPFHWLPAENRGPRFLEWLEDVEAKFELIDWREKDDGVKKRKALLAVAGAEVRNKVGTLSDIGTGYADLVNELKQDLLRDEPLVFLISQAMDMKQDEREGIDDFVMRVRKKHQRINCDAMKDKYSLNDLMIGVTITRGTTSVSIREYCLSQSGVPNIDDVLAKGRSRESMKQHDREMIGNTDTAGREITFKSEPAFTVKSRYRKYSAKFDLGKNQKAMFDTNRKCKFCGFDWPHPKRPTSCPAWGKECRKCLQKNHFARCCKEGKF
jgi:predicted HicB family RNase H-like nuclease